MLVYRQRGEYEESLQRKNFHLRFTNQLKVNAELEKNISRYSQEKEELSMEINKRINNYKDSLRTQLKSLHTYYQKMLIMLILTLYGYQQNGW